MNHFRTLPILIIVALLCSPILTDSASAAGQIAFVDWQNYLDPDYGFQFSYPPDWQMEVLYVSLDSVPEINNKRIALRHENISLAYISVWTLADGQSLQDWLIVHRQRFYTSDAEIPASPNALIGGIPAWFIISPPEEQMPGVAAAILQRGRLVYALEYIARDGGAAQETFASLLDTFHFVGDVSSPAGLPALPWFDPSLTALVQDCCGYHDGQPNPYVCVGGNCVWWAAFKRDDITTENLGNAMNWAVNAPNYGFLVGKVPLVGAVVVYQPGVQGAGSTGHVAYVESVSTSNPNYFTITEMSYGGDCTVHTRTSWVQSGVDFVYRKDTVLRPSYVDASDGEYPDKVSVVWNPSGGATHYQVWRGETPSSAAAVMLDGNVLTNSFDDVTVTPGRLYYYWVIACNDSSICTNFSSYNTGYAFLVSPPDPPSAPQASDGLYTDRISVTWLPVNGAERYELWRGMTFDAAAATLLTSNASSPYSDFDVAVHTLYYYWLKSCNATGCSNLSPFDSGYTSSLPVPSGVSASDGDWPDYVEIAFLSVPGAQEYEVYRNITNDPSGALLLGVTDASPYQDNTAEADVVYYYWVRAYNASGYSALSDPDVGSRASISLPDAFAKSSPVNNASNQSSDLLLSWSESAGALSYEYCLDTLDDDSCNGSWINVGTNTSVLLTGLSPALTYYWQVRAWNANGFRYADGGSVAWWQFSTHAACYYLHLAHTGSGIDPVASPEKSAVCSEDGTYVAGESITLSGASADPGWRIAGWTGSNNNASTASTNTLTMPATHHTVKVNYTPNCFTLTVTKSGPGALPTASPSSSIGCSAGTYAPGEVITLSGALADRGYYISGWTGTMNNSSTAATNSVSMPSGPHTAGVIYSPECYSLNFEYDPPGSGTVNLDYNERCDSGAFPYGTVVTLTAEPASGIYRFLSWSGDVTGSSNPVQVSMTHDTVITVHFEQSTFTDVPWGYWAYGFIDSLYASGITGGCSSSPLAYCPQNQVTRDQMAVFLERGIHGADNIPPPATGTLFMDVPSDFWAAPWIEQLSLAGITWGCDASNYCPGDNITRAQMAVFLLRAKHGAPYQPPDPSGVFLDVPVTHWAAAWIEQLAAEGITMGCQEGLFCPESAVTRDQMAVFLVRTFDLP